MPGQARRGGVVWLAILLAVVGSLGGVQAGLGPPLPQEQPAVRVRMEARRAAATITSTFTIVNGTDAEVREVYIAGKVPAGTDFAGVVATPEGSGFRGFEAAGTSLQAAVWLAERIPAHSSLGPFTYRVTLTGDAVTAASQVWVRWQAPSEGTVVSPLVAP
ncbi:MAG: hypothetical protein HY689_13305 [Chloroflexi bacterium]|nr:hypothetical protein [Chloroflexota bacterium]